MYYTGWFIGPSGISDLCGTVGGMVMPKGSMSTEGETLQVSVLPYRCSICSFLLCLSWLLRSRVRKFRRDLRITLYINSPHSMEPQVFFPHSKAPTIRPLSWARSIQSMLPHPNSWRFILILSSHLSLSLPSGRFPLGFPTKTLYASLISPNLFFLILTVEKYLRKYKSLSSSLCSFLHSPVTSPLLGSNILLSTIPSNSLRLRFSPLWETKFHTHTKHCS